MSEDTKELEISIEQAKAIIERGEAMLRLIANPDFSRIFTQEYFEQESIRLVRLRTEQGMQTPEAQAAIAGQMDGLGYTRMYITTILQTAEMAKRDLFSNKEELEVAEQEEVAAEV